MNTIEAGWPTRAQILEKMALVTRLAQRDAERARREDEQREQADEDAAFFTGKCHRCGDPTGPRQRWCGTRCYEQYRYARRHIPATT